MWGDAQLHFGYPSVLCDGLWDSRDAMWWAGFSVYFIVVFLMRWETTAKTTKSSPEQCLK